MEAEKTGTVADGAHPDATSKEAPDFSLAVPAQFLETVEKFIANPADEAIKKPFEEMLTKAKTQTLAKAEAEKTAAEAAKNAKPPDYSKLALPEGTKLTPKHLESVKAFVTAAKLPLETAQAILARDNDVLDAHIKGIEQDFKKYSEDSLNTLKKEWGEKFEPNVKAANQVIEFYEKKIPGIKAEIERLGLSNSTTANKLFLLLFQDLKMAPDTIERSGTQGQGAKKESTAEETASRLFPKSMPK